MYCKKSVMWNNGVHLEVLLSPGLMFSEAKSGLRKEKKLKLHFPKWPLIMGLKAISSSD